MRKIILIVVLLVGALGLAYGGRKLYQHWKTERAIAQAREAFAKSSYDTGLLWLRRTLTSDGNHLEAIRMMGDFAELARSPAALVWRSRLVEVDPTTATNRFLLANIAIRQREFATARKALEGVDTAGRKSPEFQKLTGTLAVATGQFQEAEAHFEEALKLEPTNPFPALQLSMILVQRDDPAKSARGLLMLESLRTNPAVRLDALRHLAFDAFRRTNYTRALQLTDELVRDADSVYTDRVLQLNLLVATRSPQLIHKLTAYQNQAATNSEHVFELGRWMLGSRGPAEAFAWLKSIPKSIATNFPVTLVMADTYVGLANWAALQDFVKPQHWGELEHLRLIFMARALREQGLAVAAKAEWSKASREAAGYLDRLESLYGVTVNWNWPQESEETLWSIVNRFPGQKRAVLALSDRLYANGKTRSLLTLYALEAKLDPANLAFKNNLASIALLLKSQEHQPHELAQETYAQQRDNPIIATTYAYSLHLQMKNAESLKVMNQLKPDQLERPEVAGYYGLFLASAGDKASARKYFDLATKSRLLPEEKVIFERARF